MEHKKKITDLKKSIEKFNDFSTKEKSSLVDSIEMLWLNAGIQKKKKDIKIDGNNFSLNADLIKNEILIVKGGRKINKKFLNFSMQKTYEYQLTEVLSNKISNICSLNEGLEVIKLIEKIKKIKSIN